MNVGIIGTGSRATAYYKLPLYEENVLITALCDIEVTKAEKAVAVYFKDQEIDIYSDYHTLLTNDKIEAVIICTPDFMHTEILLEAVRKGKKVLLEKPVATSKKDLKLVYQTCHDYQGTILLGFVLRYTALYKKVREIIISGKLGELISIEANETLSPIHAASFFRRWHRFSMNNGGFLNAKCSHDIDLLNLLVNEKPLYVSSFGSNLHFIKENNEAKRCHLCDKRKCCKYVNDKKDAFSSADNDLCPYQTENDIVDHQVVIVEYEKGVTASFTVSMHGGEGNRRMVIYGTEGVIRTNFLTQEVTVEYTYPKKNETYQFLETDNEHGGGDKMLGKHFICSEGINEIRDGVISSLIALAAEVSRNEKRTVSMKAFAPYLF